MGGFTLTLYLLIRSSDEMKKDLVMIFSYIDGRLYPHLSEALFVYAGVGAEEFGRVANEIRRVELYYKWNGLLLNIYLMLL